MINNPDLTESTDNDTQSAINAGVRIADVRQTGLRDGLPFVMVPNDCRLEFIAQGSQIEHPHRHIGTAKMRDVKSFTKYVNELNIESVTKIYATLEPARFIAVFNDHAEFPGFRDHRCDFTVTPSREWQTWTGRDRKSMSQLQFAELLEDNLPDIVTPAGADMLELALNFEATKNASFRSVQRLRDGSVNFSWVDETAGKDGGTIGMPAVFIINIPVFENGLAYEVTARLKYRVADGKLAIWYELVRPHKTLETAFRAIWAEIEKDCGFVYLGSPE